MKHTVIMSRNRLFNLNRKYLVTSFLVICFTYLLIRHMSQVREEIVPVARQIPDISLTSNITTLPLNLWTSHPLLPRKMVRSDHRWTLELLHTFDELLKTRGIKMVLVDGTLLGSYFFHDILPWDDDLDVMVSYEDRSKVFELFRDVKVRSKYGVTSIHSKTDWYTMESLQNEDLKDSKEDLQFKFYPLDGVPAGKYSWKWPFIDVKFYKIKDNLVEKFQNRLPDLPVPYNTFFPLKPRPLGHRWYLAPYDTRAFLKYKFTYFLCLSHDWDHKTESSARRHGVQCSEILPYYPRVHRKWLGKDTCHETLLIGNTAIHKVEVKEPYHNITGYYDLQIQENL